MVRVYTCVVPEKHWGIIMLYLACSHQSPYIQNIHVIIVVDMFESLFKLSSIWSQHTPIPRISAVLAQSRNFQTFGWHSNEMTAGARTSS